MILLEFSPKAEEKARGSVMCSTMMKTMQEKILNDFILTTISSSLATQLVSRHTVFFASAFITSFRWLCCN